MTEWEERHNAITEAYGPDAAREDAETIQELTNMAIQHSVQSQAQAWGMDIDDLENWLSRTSDGDVIAHALGVYSENVARHRAEADRQARPKNIDDAVAAMMKDHRARRA